MLLLEEKTSVGNPGGQSEKEDGTEMVSYFGPGNHLRRQ